ncbi:CDP-glycerol glycerophosphotransferase (TagB/SpsB family) [Microbacterium sp. SORGH_AS428]|uniref:CDP-glycerol glycerophosphotransferase family protein n=1 Tax=Microbacterium sp. SORGH_AS_0428 TaxID=3041788 RepID=UPI0028669BEA|nr:CDP-glycerol glycerophosphotransferase family protein [Microbacterium sp. SORGH_AS_0428]MDR6201217.1 CDP-glycerol glycerophosphotransferase (TagB/SpsB family) [Microbacterium sp. SORGH_AS_0428]
MASFSFGDGNAKKLLAIPFYAAGRVLTLLVPRARGRWVFGSAAGIADGALALWHETTVHGHRAVWLIRTDAQARDAASRGIPHARVDSLRGLWLTARAEVVVVTHGFGDVNRYAVAGSYLVQLWHGIPLKRIGIDSPETLRSSLLPSSRLVRRLLALMYRSATRRIRLLPAASHLVRGRLESAFSLDDSRVPVVGEPRVDVLSRGSATERRESARQRLEAELGPLGDDRLVLYAPTWRDGDDDPAIPTAGDWARITALLDEHGARLIVRPHPLGAGEYAPPEGTGRVHLLGSDRLADVTPVLPGMDLLVTDYSSLAYDSSLVPLPVVYFAPDVEAYARRRGFYGTYADVAGTDVAVDWEGALAQIAAVLSDDDAREVRLERARRLDALVHAHRDGRNAERVYRAITAAIGGDDPREETA